MWLLVMFDLPVLTKEDRRNYREFHDHLEDDGFSRMQFSVYARPCATEEKTAVHFNRIVDELPPDGEVRILKFTDKQWARMFLFRRSRRESVEAQPEQFEFFDEAMEPLFDERGDADVENRIRTSFAERIGPNIEKRVEKLKKRAKLKPKEEPPTLEFFD